LALGAIGNAGVELEERGRSAGGREGKPIEKDGGAAFTRASESIGDTKCCYALSGGGTGKKRRVSLAFDACKAPELSCGPRDIPADLQLRPSPGDEEDGLAVAISSLVARLKEPEELYTRIVVNREAAALSGWDRGRRLTSYTVSVLAFLSYRPELASHGPGRRICVK
jgi:hypothetical protein